MPYRCVVRISSRYSVTRSRARVLDSPPYPLCRYLTTSSRARTAWEISSRIQPAPDYISNLPHLNGLADRVRVLGRRGRATQIARAHVVIPEDAPQRVLDPIGGAPFI